MIGVCFKRVERVPNKVSRSPTSTPITSTTSTTLSAGPPTPEYADALTYDPTSQTLNDPQGTPVFALDESGAWLLVLPAAVESALGLVEATFGGKTSYEKVEVEGGEKQPTHHSP